MLIGQEEWGDDTYHNLMNGFAEQHHLLHTEPICDLKKKLFKGYTGMERVRHAGWRSVACYSPNVELFAS